MPRFQAEHAGQFNARRAADATLFAVGTDGVPIPNARHPPRKTETAVIRVGFQSHRPDGIVTTKPYRTTPAAGGYSDLQF
ncbi:hypothetical protein ACTBW4_12930 [Roseovarius pacificus]